MASYTDLTRYRKCPRLHGFYSLGYTPPAKPEAMTTGLLVHAGLAAWFRNADYRDALRAEVTKCLGQLSVIEDVIKHGQECKAVGAAHSRALQLLERYIANWGKDYEAKLVESSLELRGVTAHPDLVAFFHGERVLVDFKTSASPDVRYYDMSGQIDLYAYMLQELGSPVERVIYDVISETGLFRHSRMPRLDSGRSLFMTLQGLSSLLAEDALNNPHVNYDCPNRCDYFLPCWLLETDDIAACRDYLEANYIKGVER